MGHLTKLFNDSEKNIIVSHWEADSYSSGHKLPCICGVRGFIIKLTIECG